ncbi:MAG: GNAT family N-acetyltransferase [bacterium]|nr:GNAT family N-acetyltransferase [bacterium]
MIKFHKAKIKEVADIKKLLHESWVCTFSDIYSPEVIEIATSVWHSPELLTKQIQDPDTFFMVAVDNKRIVGICSAGLTQSGKVINIQKLHISASHHRQGIGSRLIKEIIKAFPKASKVDLEVEKQNHGALAFYQKHEFKVVGKRVLKVNNIHMPCLVMEKQFKKNVHIYYLNNVNPCGER